MTIGILEGMIFVRAPLISSQKLDTTLRTSSFLKNEDFIRAPPPEGGLHTQEHRGWGSSRSL